MPLKKSKVFALVGFLAAGALGLWMFVSGCGKDKNDVAVDPPAPPKPPALKFKEWKKPAVALLLSGEQHGYIEPCGCSETQSGGLARRADLIRMIGELGWPVAGLDLGGDLKRNNLQSKLKFDAILKALHTMDYRTMALGYEELNLNAITLLNNYQTQMLPAQEDVRPVLAGANVVIYKTPELGPVRSQVVQVGDVKIGVVAIVGPSVGTKLYGNNATGDIEIQPPAQVLPDLVQKLADEETDFNVLLSHATFDETAELLKQFPNFEIALCESGGDEGKDDPKTIGKSQVIQVGWKGKHVGVLAYYPDQKEPVKRFQFELVELDNKNFKNATSIEPILIEYQKQLKQNQSAIFEQLGGVSGSDSTYVGAATCGECHKKAYEKWKSTKHAHAYETLKTGRKGQYSRPISRIHDPECLCCHVAGWNPQAVTRYQTGFLPEELAEDAGRPELYVKLQGQQCENCHGPGSGHVDLERLWAKDRQSVNQDQLAAARKEIQLTKAAAKDHLCVKCHDYENSPKFEFDTYWDKVKHPWRD